jgi:putative inorganic carbon (HCO3(-)) transporter
VLTVFLVLMLALSPLEGYLQMVNGTLSKAAPGAFLLVWAADRAWNRRPFGTGHPIVAVAGALFVVVLLSAMANLSNEQTTFGMTRWLPYLVLSVALVDVLTHDVAPSTALTALVLGATVAAGGALFSFVFQNDPRASGPLDDPNDLAYVLAAAVPIVLARLGRATGHRLLVLLAVATLLVAGTAATVSRGGALAILSVLVWIAVRRVLPVRLMAWGAVAVIVVGGIGALLAAPQIRTALEQKTYIAATNVETRQLRWEAALRMLADHPVTGVGPAGFPANYLEYSGFAELAERTPVTHEMYLEVGAELGAPGLLLFLGLIALAAVGTELTVRRLHRSHGPDDEDLRLAAYGAQGSLLAICMASSFLSEEYYMPLWAALSIGAALELRTRPGGVSPRPRRPRQARQRLPLFAVGLPRELTSPNGLALLGLRARPEPRNLLPSPQPPTPNSMLDGTAQPQPDGDT